MHLNRRHMKTTLIQLAAARLTTADLQGSGMGKKGESRVVRHDPIGLKDSMPCHWKIFEPTHHSGITLASRDWHVLPTELSILTTINSYPGIYLGDVCGRVNLGWGLERLERLFRIFLSPTNCHSTGW